MLTAIRQWVIKTMMKNNTGVVQTLPKKEIIELNTQITAQRLMQNGIDPESLKNAKIFIESNDCQAKIMDMKGKEINPRSKIMGGQQSETEAEIAARMGKKNKESAERLREKSIAKFEKDQDLTEIEEAIDNASPGFAGDRKYDAQLVADSLAEKRFGKEFYDLDEIDQMQLYDEAYQGLSKQRFKQQQDLEKKFNKDVEEAGGLEEFLNKNPIDDDSGDFAQGGRAGFFMGSQFPKGAATLRQLLNFMGKKSDVVKNPSDILRISNPKAFNKMLEDAKGKIIPKEGIMATDRIKDYQTQMAKDRVDTVKDMLERGKRFKAADDKILGYKNEVKERFIKDLNMSEADAEKAADRMATFAMDMTKMEETPKLTKEGLLQLENILKNMETGGKKSRDLNADGGRIGFKDGMTRRTFLKILGGAMSIPIVGKILKPLKLATGVKKVPIIKTDNVAGKPEWFDALVNKVIIEGDDVTKRFATAERQSIHQKTLDDGSVVRVTEDVDDGAIRVEYESEANVYGDPVQMQYKKPLPDEGAPKPAAEFDVAESGPVGRSRGPDDYEIELDEISGTNIRDLSSDVSKLKEYATGKKPTMKEFIQNKKRRDKAKDISEGGESEMDEVIKRQGEFIQFEDIDPNMASGGIARMLGE